MAKKHALSLVKEYLAALAVENIEKTDVENRRNDCSHESNSVSEENEKINNNTTEEVQTKKLLHLQ